MNFRELRVAAEACREDSLGERHLVGGVFPNFPKPLEPHGVSVAVDGDSDLLFECPAQVGGTRTALMGQFLETLELGFFFQEIERLQDGWMQRGGALIGRGGQLTIPSQLQEVSEACIEQIRIRVFVAKAGRNPVADLAVQCVGIEPLLEKRIHDAPEQPKLHRRQNGVKNGIFRRPGFF